MSYKVEEIDWYITRIKSNYWYIDFFITDNETENELNDFNESDSQKYRLNSFNFIYKIEKIIINEGYQWQWYWTELMNIFFNYIKDQKNNILEIYENNYPKFIYLEVTPISNKYLELNELINFYKKFWFELTKSKYDFNYMFKEI